MKSYRVQILTKLGNTQYKEIEAESREAALRRAEVKFPMHKKLSIDQNEPANENRPLASTPKPLPDPEFELNLAKVKLSSREKACRRTKKEGWAFLIGGILIALAILVFTGYIVLWCAVPIMWGFGRITYGSNELSHVLKKRKALEAIKTKSIS